MTRRVLLPCPFALLVLLVPVGTAAAAPEDCFGPPGKDLEIGSEGRRST